MKTRIAQFGLGPIGMESLALAATKPWLEIIGGIDIDPRKSGRDLGELTGVAALEGRHVCSCLDELLARGKPDVILHTSVSKFAEAFLQLEPIVRQGISVVSSCEELVYPKLRQPKLAARLDELAQQNNARIFGTGVNPGFVMDVLPLCLTTVCRNVRAVHLERVVNASTRREPLQRKIGSGLPTVQFQAQLDRGEAGHAGLQESLALIGHGLGWDLEDTAESKRVIIAQEPIQTAYFTVQAGQTCGIHQRAEARRHGKICVSLDLKMYLDAKEPRDTIRIEGDPPIELLISGGVAGDAATVASIINSIPRVLQARPGLLLATDLPLPRVA